MNLTEERVEHDKGPKRRTVIPSARLMGVHQPSDRVHVEHPGLSQGRAGHDLAQLRPERAAEPFGKRHRESHLLAIQDIVRNVWLQGFLEYVLPFTPSQLQAMRQY